MELKGEDKAFAGVDAVTLQEVAAGHLHNAFEQMDLLLNTRRVDTGLVYLVAMIRSLQAVRRHVL